MTISADWLRDGHGREDTPLFRTDRLCVEPYRAAAQRRVLAADPDVRRFSCWPEADEAAFASAIAAMRSRAPRDGGWFNLAVLLADGGYAGDHALSIEIDGGSMAARLGVALLPAMRGRGLAGEVVAGTMAWLQPQGVARFRAEIDPDNAASLRTFERAGFVRLRLDRDELGPFWLLERD